ncbi:MAG: hypothetical protein J6A88_00505 [Oscillospiraceae bacterium]|nr:hypothetical protein [Oscillospiraceae bacterium]
MPIDNSLKKMILFSSPQKRKTIEGIVKDLSTLSGRSESAVIEQALEQALMPTDANARHWIKSLYDGGSLSDAYANVFSGYAAGLNWQARWSNGRPLVEEFSRNLAMTFPRVTGEEHELNHLCSQVNTIYNILPDDIQTHSDRDCWRWYINQLREDPQQVSMFDFTSLILLSWDWVGNHTATYRALVDVCRISAPSFCSDSYSRVQFIHVIKQLSAEWSKS